MLYHIRIEQDHISQHNKVPNRLSASGSANHQQTRGIGTLQQTPSTEDSSHARAMLLVHLLS